LFDGKNISFDASLVIYINSINIPPIMIINRIYENSKSSVAVACFLPGRAKDLSAPLYSVTENPRIFHLMLALLYIYINSINIPPIMIINRIYEHQNLLSP
jgi:hypothetical protein